MNPDISLTERWLWLIISLGLSIFTIGVRQVLDLVTKDKAKPKPIFDLPWVIQPLRILYAVGIPTLAILWRGALTERWMGLKPMPWKTNYVSGLTRHQNWEMWVQDITTAFGIGMLAWLILAMGDYCARRNTRTRRNTSHNLGIALREAIYHQVHWAFYREPFVLLWGVELGAWAGLIPVCIEAGLNPERWMDLSSPAQGRNLLMRIGFAGLSTLLYLQTQNLWLAILIDTLLGWALGQAQSTQE